MTVTIRHGDCREVLKTLPDKSVHCCVTSPPYFGLRDYGNAGQIGLEATPDAFVAEMVAVFREVRRVLRDDGTLWLNLGDSYNAARDGGHAGGKKQADLARHIGITRSGANVPGLKAKDLIGIPWRVAFALQSDGWYLRQDIIWSKPNPMPESVTDRCTKAHEYIFLLSKSARYYYNADLIAEKSIGANSHGSNATSIPNRKDQGSDLNRTWGGDTRNKRSVWEIATAPFSEAHFATFPPALIEPCILAGSCASCCSVCGQPATNKSKMWKFTCDCAGEFISCTVLDPFGGAGTTGMVSDRLGRDAILIELNPEYAAMAHRRIEGDAGMFAEVSTLTPADRS